MEELGGLASSLSTYINRNSESTDVKKTIRPDRV